MYYENGNVDGSENPIFVNLYDSSGVLDVSGYNYALAKTYVDTGKTYLETFHVSNYNQSFNKQNCEDIGHKCREYLVQRGMQFPAADYYPSFIDTSGLFPQPVNAGYPGPEPFGNPVDYKLYNPGFENIFYNFNLDYYNSSTDTYSQRYGIEFGGFNWDSAASKPGLIPTELYLNFFVKPNLQNTCMGIGPKYLYDPKFNSKPVTIPITPSLQEFGTNKVKNISTVYYNIDSKILHIYYDADGLYPVYYDTDSSGNSILPVKYNIAAGVDTSGSITTMAYLSEDLGIDIVEKHKMNHFEASFAIRSADQLEPSILRTYTMKASWEVDSSLNLVYLDLENTPIGLANSSGNLISGTNEYTVERQNPKFIQSTINNQDAFLVQISPILTATDQVYVGTNDGSGSWGQTFTLDTSLVQAKGVSASSTLPVFVDTYPQSIQYTGWSLPKMGFGRPGFDVIVSTPITLNANDVDMDTFLTPNIGNKGVGNNPYTTQKEYLASPDTISLWDNPFWNQININIGGSSREDKLNVFNKPPEWMVDQPANICQNADQKYAIQTICLHELAHSVQIGTGVVGAGGNGAAAINYEGQATVFEIDSIKYMESGLGCDILFRFVDFSIKNSLEFRGTQVSFKLGRINSYPDDKYTVATLGLPYIQQLDPNANVNGAFGTGLGSYMEGSLYWYIKENYDDTMQVIRRMYDILNISFCKVLYDQGITRNPPYITVNLSTSQLAYKQALLEVTGKDFATVLSDYVVQQGFQRNNSIIPTKYHSKYPYWIMNKNNQFTEKFIEQLNSYNIIVNGSALTYLNNIWNLVDESQPFDWTAAGGAIGWTGRAYCDGIPSVPFWPRYFENASGVDSSGNATLETDLDYRIYNILYKDYYGGSVLDASGNAMGFGIGQNGTGSGFLSTFYGTADISPPTNIYCNSFLKVLEDLAYVGMTIDTDVISSITLEVNRGEFNIKVAKFVPNGTEEGGSWNEWPVDASGYHNINVAGDYDTVTHSWSNVDGSSESVTIDFSALGFTKSVYNDITYYPKLFVINKGIYDYGTYSNIYPGNSRYTGEVKFSATFV